jgi:heme a synthase
MASAQRVAEGEQISMKAKTVSKSNPWLYGFAVLTALATLALLGIGGLVTSHEAGMSVPDWPTTYGYNMFLFPINKWLGGIFYEHSHRLLASLVGLMTTILAVWLWLKDRRPWMSWLGVAAFLLVVAQGVLGGLRVRWSMDSLGIYHGIIAQSFFVLTCAIALFTSRWWMEGERRAPAVPEAGAPLHGLVLATTVLIFIQLIIAAAMRHQHAGLAITDFPLAHGQLWPNTSADAVANYNAQRITVNGVNPITAFQIYLQMAHRLVAVAILVLTVVCVRRARNSNIERRLAYLWLGLVVAQAGLGAATIWSNKAADVATAHVLVGALILAVGALWCVIAFRDSAAAAFERQCSPNTVSMIDAQPAAAGNK